MTFPIVQDKVTIVTGAAMGMGRETAILFAEAGAKVVVADFNEELGRRTADDIVATGGEAMFHKVDISKGVEVEALVTATVAEYGRLDIAVNNAALKPDSSPIDEFDEQYWDRLMAVDLKGTALCMKYEIRQFVRQGGGTIVNISSINGFKPTLNSSGYIAAKHGVVGLTRAAALEFGPQNIRVNSIAPGAIRTPMLDAVLATQNRTIEEMVPSVSLVGRLGEPREVAQATLWIASDLASYVHGTTLHVGGGFELL
ncbi:SDR family NAD(P)-dependent oxidoreductase [Microbacterium sp. Bi128]|uniref:SDR family NAD(P)-dependent oxidoreductase n=1 Tax=Microbacterium sp. Bi128 TaxID=2821115 RepID=UPI001E1AE2D1|nr:glucose 1-dehydrogenase [Microbacterium sp. Bi128]CAH0165960.1 2,5-dichloro-2,5-cyclohexadiene-1,4-diol dehydrogenase [Microbacterium sp. Bi128]